MHQLLSYNNPTSGKKNEFLHSKRTLLFLDLPALGYSVWIWRTVEESPSNVSFFLGSWLPLLMILMIPSIAYDFVNAHMRSFLGHSVWNKNGRSSGLVVTWLLSVPVSGWLPAVTHTV